MPRLEDDERHFYQFMQEILDAIRQSQIAGKPFTRKTLKGSLQKICNVLARWAGVESVTVHLKIYDPSVIMKEGGDEPDEDSVLYQRIKQFRMNDEGKPAPYPDGLRPGKHQGWRDDPLTSTLAFPFTALPRGGLQLIACNDDSPWNKLLAGAAGPGELRGTELYSIVRLDAGVSANIVQENWARKHDREKILATRNDRKLGYADALVWHNQGLRGMFRNYFGVPIKLHLDGEVVGILKLENKVERDATEPDREPSDRRLETEVGREATGPDREPSGPKTMRDLAEEIREILKARVGFGMETVDSTSPLDEELKRLNLGELLTRVARAAVTGQCTDDRKFALPELKACGSSLLALAYLLEDLGQADAANGLTEGEKQADRDLVEYFPEYPHRDRLLKQNPVHDPSHIKSLLPGGAGPSPEPGPYPPVQFWPSTEAAADWLCMALVEQQGPENATVSNLLEWVGKLRTELGDRLRELRPDFGGAKDQPVEMCGLHFTARRDRPHGKGDLPAFTYCLIHESPEQASESRPTFYAVIPPRPGQDVTSLDNRIAEGYLGIFDAVNPHWSVAAPGADVESFEYLGERVVAVTIRGERSEVDLRGKLEVPDLLVDRLAARVQALIYSLPIKDFGSEDWKFLTGAAREIANLVQKVIVDRGNSHERPMPLTQLEFERLPISDLSFVDDLRHRVSQAESIRDNIDHHINNVLTDWKMASTVRASSRVKGYRSHLERLGERHEGYIRGAIATWFLLLSKQVEEPGRDFISHLSSFGAKLKDRIAAAVKAGAYEALTADVIDAALTQFDRWKTPPDGLPFADLGFFSWPWLDGYGPIRGRELWQLAAENLRKLGSHREAKFAELGNVRPIKDQDLANCVLRNHEPYARLASSLLVQLYESRHDREGYPNFYRTLFGIRRLLSRPARELEDDPKLHGLWNLFYETDDRREWAELSKAILTQSTGEFLENHKSALFGVDDRFCARRGDIVRARLSAAGIYKRIRTLNYRLREQLSTAHLEWELGRFDLLGCQINCLYKNQVAAVYEDLWDRGDPFSGRTGRTWDSSRRVRWMCLRTNVHSGVYNSLQIAALVDPSSIQRGFYDAGTEEGRPKDEERRPQGAVYNLSLLRFYWTWFLEQVSPGPDEASAADSFRSRYSSLARLRNPWIKEYIDWFVKAERIWQSESKRPPGSFDLFFGEAVVDLILWSLAKLKETRGVRRTDQQSGDESGDEMWLRDHLERITGELDRKLRGPQDSTRNSLSTPDAPANPPKADWASAFLREFIEGMRKVVGEFCSVGEDEMWLRDHLERSIGELGRELRGLLDSVRNSLSTPNALAGLLRSDGASAFLREHIEKMRNAVDEFYSVRGESFPGRLEQWCEQRVLPHEEQFLKTFKEVIPQERLQFVTSDCSREPGRLFERSALGLVFFVRGLLNSHEFISFSRHLESQDYDLLFRAWERYRRSQKDYLFWLGEGLDDRAHGLRTRNEVMGRIENYTLLYSAGVVGDDVPVHLRFWNARDLFYYVRSLIPAEFQVRTHLANVLANQYHDRVYKQHPQAASMVPRTRMNDVAASLDDLDRELEVDFEDYIERESR